MRICDYKFAVYGFFAEHRAGATEGTGLKPKAQMATHATLVTSRKKF
jgi:hypothetical protein